MEPLDLFSTPVFVLRPDALQPVAAPLAAALVAEAEATPGIQRANAGGWHSVPDLALREVAPFPAFFAALVPTIQEALAGLARRAGRSAPSLQLGVQAWAMVMGPGHYTVLHDHAESHLSGVFYADAGDPAPDPSGHLALIRPGGGFAEIPGLSLMPSTFTLRPRTGHLVLFPGMVQHYVHPYQGRRPRVSVAFNVQARMG